MQRHGRLHQVLGHALHVFVEPLEVSREEGEVDGVQRHGLWQADGECGEPALQTRVDLEGACCGIHTRHQLCVTDVLRGELCEIVHVLVLQVLAQQGDGTLRVVGIDLG